MDLEGHLVKTTVAVLKKSLYSQWFPWGLDIMTLNVVHGLWRLINNTYLCSEETQMMKKRRLYSS